MTFRGLKPKRIMESKWFPPEWPWPLLSFLSLVNLPFRRVLVRLRYPTPPSPVTRAVDFPCTAVPIDVPNRTPGLDHSMYLAIVIVVLVVEE